MLCTTNERAPNAREAGERMEIRMEPSFHNALSVVAVVRRE